MIAADITRELQAIRSATDALSGTVGRVSTSQARTAISAAIGIKYVDRLVDAMSREAERMCSDSAVVDPNDELSLQLLDLQKHIGQIHARADGAASAVSWTRPLLWLATRYVRSRLASQHAQVGRIRTVLMEHDADAAPIGPAFADAKALGDYLRRHDA